MFFRSLLMPKIYEDPAIDVMYEAAARELVQDPDTREILGVVLESDGGDVRVRAKNGVVMALGGYEGNLRRLQDYCHLKYAYPKGSTYNTGDGVVMAMKVGADLWHMSNPSGPDLNFYDPESKAYFGYTLASSLGNRTAIYVGPDGTRFIDEATMTKHGKMYTHGTYQTAVSALPAYAVFDEAALSAGPLCSAFWSEDNSEEIEKGWIKRADTLQELAEMIGVPADGLIKTVERFAFYCEQGDVYKRQEERLFVRPHAGILVDGGQSEFLLVLGKLAGDAVEHRDDLELVAARKASHVVAVEGENPPLDFVDRCERALLDVGGYCLGHAAYKHVFTQEPHGTRV